MSDEVASEIEPPPNNGMHPTADMKDFIYLQSLVAAGDAGRSAAF